MGGEGTGGPDDRRLQGYVAAVVAVGAVTGAAAVATAPERAAAFGDSLPVALLLGVAALILGLVHVRVPVRGTLEAMNLSEAAYVPIMVLLPPELALPTAGLAALVSEAVLTRGRLERLAFNVGWLVTAIAAGSWAYAALAGRAFDGRLVTVLAALVAGAVFVTVNLLAFTGVIALRSRRRWTTVVREEAASSAVLNFGTAATGVLAAALLLHAPAALPLLALPTALHLSRLGARSEGHERIAAERSRFERTVAGTSDGIVLLDPDARVEVWNPRMAALTGITAEKALGTTLPALGLDVLSGEPEAERAEWRVELAGGTVDVRVAGVDEGGRSRARVLSVRDVTREAELARIRDDLVSRISHELRTPLTTVGGFLETLESRWEALDEPRRRELVAVAGRATDRLSSLVANLMVWARIESPAQPLGGSDTPVAPVLADVLDELHLAVELTSGSPDASVGVPPDDLRTVLRNLLQNAAVYGAGPIEVDVRVPGDVVELVVTDHGDGLPADFRASLYEPFRQASEGLQRTAKGLGLGLAVVRAIAERAGGSIAHDDVAGGGSRFTVRLPAGRGR